MNTYLRALLLLFFVLPGAAFSASLSDLTGMVKSGAPSLSGLLSSQLGVNQDQAEGGVGSILSLAKEKLKSADYSKVAESIPGAQGYVDKAKNLGAVTGKLKNLQGLNKALGKLGMSPETVAKFTPTVIEYAGKLGGTKTQALLSSVIK